MLCPLHSLVSYELLDLFCIFNSCLQLFTVWRADSLFASGTVQEIKDDSRSDPLLLELRQDAVQVEYMLALKLHARLSAKTANPTDRAKLVTISVC